MLTFCYVFLQTQYLQYFCAILLCYARFVIFCNYFIVLYDEIMVLFITYSALLCKFKLQAQQI